MPATWPPAAGAFFSGAVLHQMAFRHGEWHLHGLDILGAYFALTTTLLLLFKYVINPGAGPGSITPFRALEALAYHLAGVYTSTLVYRTFFHRLGHFPGPFAAKVSGAYKAYLARNLRMYQEVRSLHRQYGDVVRVGPSELSLASPAAVKKVHWPQATPRKSPSYDQQLPRVSLETTRDHQQHAQLRKIWDRAFNTRAIRDYSSRVQKHAARLSDVFDSNLDQSIDITRWMNYYSFDVMGDLAFGKSFDMVIDKRENYMLSIMHKHMGTFARIGLLTWALPVLVRIPLLNHQNHKFWKFVGDQVSWRLKNPPDSPDVFHWILQGFGDRVNTEEGMMNLEAEAQLVIIAGSDTTSSALTNAIFQLLNHPEQMEKLRAEFKQQVNRDMSEIAPEDLANLPHLNAVLYETLRLHPPVISGVQRQVSPSGLQVAETFIPGDTIIQIPFYTVFRDERCFQDPDSFIPERWTEKSELTVDPSVFVPFNHGTHACVGKQLALMELRWVLTMIITQYDLEFAPEHDNKTFLDGTVDGFTAVCAPLYVRLSRREKD
ncbi:cytochrome P450 [Aspergillus stella-maris]|uniref:cytochrome P450 n=1 Tax=Aspergillus stella-maris TaxID=1810926 RepID=UPI003CCD248B